MTRNPKVGRRQWEMLCALGGADGAPMTVDDLLRLTPWSPARGSLQDGIKGLANKGLVTHLCHDTAECRRPVEIIGRWCRLGITERGMNAEPSRAGRPRRRK